MKTIQLQQQTAITKQSKSNITHVIKKADSFFFAKTVDGRDTLKTIEIKHAIISSVTKKMIRNY